MLANNSGAALDSLNAGIERLNKRNLYCFVRVYKFFPEIFHAVSRKSQMGLLSWAHQLIAVENFAPKKASYNHFPGVGKMVLEGQN